VRRPNTALADDIKEVMERGKGAVSVTLFFKTPLIKGLFLKNFSESISSFNISVLMNETHPTGTVSGFLGNSYLAKPREVAGVDRLKSCLVVEQGTTSTAEVKKHQFEHCLTLMELPLQL